MGGCTHCSLIVAFCTHGKGVSSGSQAAFKCPCFLRRKQRHSFNIQPLPPCLTLFASLFSQVWPIILSGHDLIGIAATGSGKTLGFGLPMLAHIKAQRDNGVVTGKGPIALVMAPTRELALQIAAVLEDAGSKCGIGSVCVYGGVPKGPQVSALRSGVDIVVGTPGRLEDLMQEGACKLQVGRGCCWW